MDPVQGGGGRLADADGKNDAPPRRARRHCLTACGSAQMQKSREVRSHEGTKKRQEQLNRKPSRYKNALRRAGPNLKTLHELRMKKQHKNRAKLSKKRRPAFDHHISGGPSRRASSWGRREFTTFSLWREVARLATRWCCLTARPSPSRSSHV